MMKKKLRPSGVFAGRSVLIVDDEPIIRQLLKNLLIEIGFEHVECAVNGSDALRMLDRFRVDLILTDIVMQPMSGIEFAEVLRKSAATRFDARTANTPLVFVSASSDHASILRAKELGAKAFIAKPIDPLALRERLIRVFQ